MSDDKKNFCVEIRVHRCEISENIPLQKECKHSKIGYDGRCDFLATSLCTNYKGRADATADYEKRLEITRKKTLDLIDSI